MNGLKSYTAKELNSLITYLFFSFQISVFEKIDILKKSFETWWAKISSKFPPFRRLEDDLLDIEVDTVILNYLFGFNIPELNDKIENNHQKALNEGEMRLAVEELKVAFDELKEKYEVFVYNP